MGSEKFVKLHLDRKYAVEKEDTRIEVICGVKRAKRLEEGKSRTKNIHLDRSETTCSTGVLN